MDNEIATGKIINIQCKSNENKRKIKYAKIDKSDALLYLTSNLPVCLVGIEFCKQSNSSNIFTWLIDEELVVQLVDFLKSKNDSLNIPFSDLKDNENFFIKLKKVCTSDYMQRIKIFVLEYYIGNNIKINSEINAISNTIVFKTGYQTEIINPDVIFASDNQPRKIEDLLNVDILRTLELFDFSIHNFSIHGNIGEKSIISSEPHENVRALALVYPYNNLICYRMKSGVTFNFKRELTGINKDQHEGFITIENSMFSIIDCPEDLNVLQYIILSNSLTIDGTLLMNELHDAKDLLIKICYFMDLITKADKHSDVLSFKKINLYSIFDHPLKTSLIFISSIVLKEDLSEFIPGVFFEYDGYRPGENPVFTRLKKIGIVPVVFSISSTTYILNLKCEYNDLVNEQSEIVGIELLKKIDFTIEVSKDLEEFDYPQIWAYDKWPAIKVNFTEKMQTSVVKRRPYNLKTFE